MPLRPLAAIALFAAALFGAPALAQSYDLYLIDNAETGERIHAVVGPNDHWAAIRAAGLATQLDQGDVVIGEADAASDDGAAGEDGFRVVSARAELGFSRAAAGAPSAVMGANGATGVFVVRISDVPAAEAAAFIDEIEDAPEGLRAGMRAALGL